MSADRPDAQISDRRPSRPGASRDGQRPAVASRVSTLDRVTLRLGVVVAVPGVMLVAVPATADFTHKVSGFSR